MHIGNKIVFLKWLPWVGCLVESHIIKNTPFNIKINKYEICIYKY